METELEDPPPVEGGLGWDSGFYVHGDDRRFFGSGTPGACIWDGPTWTDFRQNITHIGAEASGATRC
jgi:hypothetical protein